MKIKLETIVNNVENLKTLQKIEMPFKVAYKIKRLIDKLQPALKIYDEKRTELVKKYGEPIDKDEEKGFQVIPEKLEDFYKELQEVVLVEEEIDFDPIKTEDLGDVKLAPNQIIDFVFED